MEVTKANVEMFGQGVSTVLEVGGDRVVLVEWLWQTSEDYGLRMLGLTELDDAGQRLRMAIFDPEGLDHARAELARWEAGTTP